MPKGVAIALNDLLDHCAEINAGEEVVIMAHMDGIVGGDNLVDPQVVAWLESHQEGRRGRGSDAPEAIPGRDEGA
jgi:hypothetical protein